MNYRNVCFVRDKMASLRLSVREIVSCSIDKEFVLSIVKQVDKSCFAVFGFCF